MVDDELHRHFNEQLSAMGAFLNGRVTYELMAGFWPTADTDPSSTAPMVEFARIWRDMPKIVFSRTLERADRNTTVVRDLVAEEVMELKVGRSGMPRPSDHHPRDARTVVVTIPGGSDGAPTHTLRVPCRQLWSGAPVRWWSTAPRASPSSRRT